jgi:hypothetical protein
MALGALSFSHATTLTAAVHTVAAGGGGNYTSIQAAINAASGGDTIRIIESPHTEKGIDVTKSLTFEGLGADQTVIQAHADPGVAGNRIFYISAVGAIVQFKDMTLQHGNPTTEGGGAIWLPTAKNNTLIVTRCWFKDNIVLGNGSGTAYGGAIRITGNSLLSVADSTFAGNLVTNWSAAHGGAIYASGGSEYTIRNSTFSRNALYASSSDGQRGGGLNVQPSTTGRVDNCTFYANRAVRTGTYTTSRGGGIFGTTGKLVVESCVFDNNFAGTAAASDADTVIYANCVYENTPNNSTSLGGNLLTADAKVDTNLADNGGRTPTHALLEGSPAINKGSNPAALSFDQRGTGYAREVPAGAPDCGAFEYGAGTPPGTLIMLR